MININLLPESMRKREGMPKQQLLGIVVCLGILGGLVWMITKYQFETLPALRDSVRSLQARKSSLEKEVEELKTLNAEITRKSGFVNTVKGLYSQRVVWAKILADMKKIINFDESVGRYNQDMRYVWLTNFDGNGKKITLRCIVTAGTQLAAMQLQEQLLQSIQTYKPTNTPEKDEEERLQAELKEASNKHLRERQDNPELPLQGPEEAKIRQRLEEIKNIKSGGLAMIPFNELLVPGSLRMSAARWGSAPKPRNTSGAEIFPENAWIFDLTMQLK